MATPADREKCSCYYVGEHTGDDAEAYVRDHLEAMPVESEPGTAEYRCPLFGKRWLLERDFNARIPSRLRTFEVVARDLRYALFSVHTLMPADDEATRAAMTLRQKIDDADLFRHP